MGTVALPPLREGKREGCPAPALASNTFRLPKNTGAGMLRKGRLSLTLRVRDRRRARPGAGDRLNRKPLGADNGSRNDWSYKGRF